MSTYFLTDREESETSFLTEGLRRVYSTDQKYRRFVKISSAVIFVRRLICKNDIKTNHEGLCPTVPPNTQISLLKDDNSF
jgi:hypothetical protein